MVCYEYNIPQVPLIPFSALKHLAHKSAKHAVLPFVNILDQPQVDDGNSIRLCISQADEQMMRPKVFAICTERMMLLVESSARIAFGVENIA